MADETPPRNPIRPAVHLGLRNDDAVDADVSNEIDFHLRERIDALIARGWSEADAIAEARRRFGDPIAARDALSVTATLRDRRLTWLERVDAIVDDVKLAARRLRLAPTFALGVVLTLALGIGANATMFSVIDRLLFRPPAAITAPQYVYTFQREGRGARSVALSYAALGNLRSLVGADAHFAAESFRSSMAIGVGNETHAATTVFVDDEYFSMLGVRASRGRLISTDDAGSVSAPAVAVISDALWQSRFARDPNVIGRAFTINNEQLRIIGVAPRDFNGVTLEPIDVWLPLPLAARLTFVGAAWNTSAAWLFPIARLARDVDPVRVQREVTAFRRAMERDLPRGDTTIAIEIHSILPSRSGSLSAEAKIATLLGAVSLVVFLVACTNAANLALARAIRRQRETAIRVALGVSRARLVQQVAIDALLLSALGGVAAVGIAAGGAGLMRRLLLNGLAWDGNLVDASMAAFLAIAVLVAAALTSILPAWMTLRRVNLAQTIGNAAARQSGRSHRSFATTSLVVAQTALASVLLIGAVLFVSSLENVKRVPYGMDLDHLVVATIDPQHTRANDAAGEALFTELAARAARLPAVQSVAISDGIPFAWFLTRRIAVPSLSPELEWIKQGAAFRPVTSTYFATMGARIIRGHGFATTDDRGDGALVAIVDVSLANALWPAGDAVGKCIQVAVKAPESTSCRRIVGVAEDLRIAVANSDSRDAAAVYVPLSQGDHLLQTRDVIIRTTGDADDVSRQLLQLAYNADYPLPVADVWTMASKLEPQMRPWKLGASMFGAFGSLAFLLAALGTYSVIAYSVAQRTQEMGVRIALGARTRDILALVTKQGAALAAIGVTVALLASAALAPLIQPLLFETNARSIAVYASVTITVLGVALLASLIPAWRGARVDPLTAIRAE